MPTDYTKMSAEELQRLLNGSSGTYTDIRQQFVSRYGEQSLETTSLDQYRSDLIAGRNGDNTVDASNQSNQGPIRSATNPYSDEDVSESLWFEDQLRREKNRERYEIMRNPDNYTGDDIS